MLKNDDGTSILFLWKWERCREVQQQECNILETGYRDSEGGGIASQWVNRHTAWKGPKHEI